MNKGILNQTKKQYPFLYQREISIFLVVVDYILFRLFFINSLFPQNSIINNIIFPLIWIVSNYIFSQYISLKKYNSRNLIKKIIFSQLANIISFIIIFLNITLIISFNNFSFLYGINFFCYSIIFSLISCFCRLLIIYFTNKINKKILVFGFWGTNEKFEIIKSLYLRYINFKVEFKLINNENFNFMIDKVDKILIPIDFKFEKELEKINYTKREEINNKFIDLTSWSSFFLQRYPYIIIEKDKKILHDLNLIQKKLSYKLKIFIEFIISLFLIILFTPIILFFGIIIKLEDGGPIFYTQKRTGLNGKIFDIYKLRTMKIDSEKGKAMWSYIGDNRITKIGQFLRKSRFDELPQLLCVLKGDMSLIGPRPERPEFDEMLSKEIKIYNARNFLKPGISGWSQVSYPYGASVRDAEIKLSFDIYYIKNFSLIFDLLIFFKTIRLVLRLENSQPRKKNEDI